MKKNIYNKFSLMFVATVMLMLFSCKKAFDLKPQSVVDISDNYRNVYDANAAVIGIYGKLMGIAEQYVVLNELRADLMDVTNNADKYLIDISQHTVTQGNPWADPRPFYNIILNCNDVLYNLNIMFKDKRISADDYNQRYSDVGAVRSWLYLQLGIHFGTIPYVTDPISNVNDLKDASKYPRIPLTQLIDKLVTFVELLPSLDPYAVPLTTTSAASTSLITTVDGYSTVFNFINKNALLGDLYLWQGNTNPASYVKAATSYRAVLDYPTNTNPNYDVQSTSYRVQGHADVNGLNDLAVSYTRYKESDINSLVNNNSQGWRSIFARAQDKLFGFEWIWVMNFDQAFVPADPFVDLFSNQGGKYLVKPSQTAYDNWNSQVQGNGFPYDQRGPFTVQPYPYPQSGGKPAATDNPVILKYLYNYLDGTSFLPIKPLQKSGKWLLTRAASVHLHFAEAANRDGRTKLAYAFLNIGLLGTYNVNYPFAAPADVTNTEQTFDSKPYDFDARLGDTPRYRSYWYQNGGVRGRAYVKPYDFATYTNNANMLAVEDQLLKEDGLELAYEGQRWPDLLRIALRRNDPSIIAGKIFDKLSKDGYGGAAAAAQAKLAAGNYFLPFNW